MNETKADTTLPSSSTFYDLPYRLQCQILSYLDLPQLLQNVAPLNRYFYNLTRDKQFWHTLDFTNSQCQLSLAYLRQLLHWAESAHTVILSRQSCERAEITNDASEIIGEVLQRCPNLIYLQLAYLRPSLETLKLFCTSPASSHCQLRHLDLSGSENLTPDLVEALAKSCPRLESLSLAHCRRSCDSSTGQLGHLLPSLTYINLDENIVPSESLRDLLLSCCDRLERVVLDASGCEDKHLAEAVSQCRHLRLLTCHFAEDLGNDLLSRGLSRLTSLESLTLRKAHRVSDAAFEQLGLATHFTNLTHLDLTECRSLTDVGLGALVAKSGHRLEILVLNWCWMLTDCSMDLLLQTAHLMRSLSLVGLHQLTGKQLLSVPASMPRLLFVDFRSCNAIQDSLLSQLALAMPQLCIVDFFGCVVEGGQDDPRPDSAVGFAFTEKWTRPLRLLQM